MTHVICDWSGCIWNDGGECKRVSIDLIEKKLKIRPYVLLNCDNYKEDKNKKYGDMKNGISTR